MGKERSRQRKQCKDVQGLLSLHLEVFPGTHVQEFLEGMLLAWNFCIMGYAVTYILNFTGVLLVCVG